MTITNLPPLVVGAVMADRIAFSRGTFPEVSVSMTQAADALTEVIGRDGYTVLGGHLVDESDVLALMNAMREASGLIRCSQCRQWDEPSGTSDLCSQCRRELRRADWLAESSMGEH